MITAIRHKERPCTQACQSYSDPGVSVVEIVVALFFVGISMGALFSVLTFSVRTSGLQQQELRAQLMAQEALEAVREYRSNTEWDAGVGSLNTSMEYHPALTGDPEDWTFSSGSEDLDGFTRSVVFNDVYRDGSDNITTGGGSLDSDSREVVVTVEWDDRGRGHEVTHTAIITNWR